MKQRLTFIRGVPGSGKTTRALTMTGTLIEADHFFINQQGQNQYNARFIKDAHAWCQLEMKRHLLSGRDVIVANTFVKRWEVLEYLHAANTLGLDLDIAVIEVQGHFNNVHNVPKSVVEKMRREFEAFSLTDAHQTKK